MYIPRFEGTSVGLSIFFETDQVVLGIKILKQIEWPGDCIFLLQGICVKIKFQYVASVGSRYQHQKGAKVLLTT